MYVQIVDYHGNHISIDPSRVIKLRAATLSDEPLQTVFIDYASNGTFAKGTLTQMAKLFGTYIKLAELHAPDGTPIFVNKAGIAAVGVDNKYAGNAVLIVTVEFENMRVPARNKIAVQETAAEAQAILDAATFAV
jgi:hypothetical protein